jgi:hypothetical protein
MVLGFTPGIVVAKVSGEAVIAKISGETVIGKVSGETIIGKISGEVSLISGQAVIGKISGETVIAKISGEAVVTAGAAPPTILRTGRTLIPATSGGVQLAASASIDKVTMLADQSNANDIFFAASGQAASGVGFKLRKGDSADIEIDNLNKIYLFAITSGDAVWYFGVD